MPRWRRVAGSSRVAQRDSGAAPSSRTRISPRRSAIPLQFRVASGASRFRVATWPPLGTRDSEPATRLEGADLALDQPQELLGARLARVVQHLLGRALLDDAPVV